jgi:hypothetical protein
MAVRAEYTRTVRPEPAEGWAKPAGLNSKPTSSGVARQQVTFFCFAKKKVTKE